MIFLLEKKFISLLVKVDIKNKNFNLQRLVFFTNYAQNKLVGNISEVGHDKPRYV
jgi:hypothetical protein